MAKEKRWRFMSVFAAVMVMGIMIFGLTAYAADAITVQVNGQTVQLEQEPVIVDGRVMAPVTRIAEAMGWSVEIGPHAVYLKNHGGLEIIPGKLYYTYYQSDIGITEGYYKIRHYDTLGSFDIDHFNHGHFPAKHNEICPGELPCGLLAEAEAYQLTVVPTTVNGTLYIAVRDLAAAMYASAEWDENTRTLNIVSGLLPYYDGNGLPDEYREWLLQRTYEAHEQNGAIAPAPADTPALSKEEKLTALEVEIIRLVNEIRQQEGLTQLETFEGLDSAADLRGGELLTKFAHMRPSGEPASSAYEGLQYSYGGENIVRCSATLYGAEAADGLVSILMGSESHKKIILNPELRYIGVGAAFDDEHTLYCVQGFMK
ncbi:MAG: CAP domain-containing protein [Clostridiales bacterium]|nr:CAP domain-containing protein [Clostridiales bacterium]